MEYLPTKKLINIFLKQVLPNSEDSSTTIASSVSDINGSEGITTEAASISAEAVIPEVGVARFVEAAAKEAIFQSSMPNSSFKAWKKAKGELRLKKIRVGFLNLCKKYWKCTDVVMWGYSQNIKIA